jgi:hypothetical protein
MELKRLQPGEINPRFQGQQAQRKYEQYLHQSFTVIPSERLPKHKEFCSPFPPVHSHTNAMVYGSVPGYFCRAERSFVSRYHENGSYSLNEGVIIITEDCWYQFFRLRKSLAELKRTNAQGYWSLPPVDSLFQKHKNEPKDARFLAYITANNRGKAFTTPGDTMNLKLTLIAAAAPAQDSPKRTGFGRAPITATPKGQYMASCVSIERSVALSEDITRFKEAAGRRIQIHLLLH